MRTIRAALLCIGGLFKKDRRDRDLTAELESHLQLHIDDNLRAGMTPEEAQRRAKIALGGVEQVKEQVRAARTGAWFGTLMKDVRFGLRMLRKNPGFTAVVVLTLALGIGANSAIFSVVDAVLLRPLRAPQPDRLVIFAATTKAGSGFRAADIEFNLWRKQASVLEEVSGYRDASYYLTGVDQPQKVNAMLVTEDYFRLFGLPIAHGRGFTPEDEQGTGRFLEEGHAVVLSDGFWKRAFGGNPHTIGQVIFLSGNPYLIVGVMAPKVETETPDQPDVWLPFPISLSSTNQVHYFQAAGRLKNGVTLDVANVQLELMTQEFRREYPGTISAKRGDAYSVQEMRGVIVKDVRLSLLALIAAVGLLLLISCANVASLLLARGASRTHEMAVRVSLGASHGRIIRQLFTENILLTTTAALLGLVVGFVGVHALLRLVPFSIPRIGAGGSNVTMDWRILSVTLLITMIIGLLFGLVPGISAFRIDPIASLNQSGSRTGTGPTHAKTRSLLVIAEISLALVLLIVAALFSRTLVMLRSVDPGFDPHDVVTTRTPLDPKLFNSSSVDQVMRNASQRLGNLPGIEAAAVTTLLPLDGDYNSLPIGIVGRSSDGDSDGFARQTFVSPDYFAALKIPLLRGRFFTEADGLDSPPVVVIDQTMARQLWPHGDPLGAQIVIGKGLGASIEEPARQIVGIVGDVRDNGLGLPPQPSAFIPAAQRQDARWSGATVTWVVRTRAHSPSLDAAIQESLRQTTGLPIPPLRPMDEVIAQSTSRESFNMLLMSILGIAALLLAAVGIYGVMAYLVAHRTHEIGIRMALGAQRSEILTMVLGSATTMALIGIAIGIAVGVGLTHFVSGMLFGVGPADPITFTLTPLGLLVVALAASYVPARRAMRVDPMIALRHE